MLSIPKRLGPYLHGDMRIAGAVLQIFLRATRTTVALTKASPLSPPTMTPVNARQVEFQEIEKRLAREKAD